MAVFPTNAVLTFQMPSSSTQVDELGNPIVSSTTLTVEASLSLKGRQNQESAELANRVDVMAVKGRCNKVFTDTVTFTPPRLPPGIKPGVQVPCTLTNRDTDETTEGEFILEISLPSKWGVDKVLGGQINGYFFIKSVFGEVS